MAGYWCHKHNVERLSGSRCPKCREELRERKRALRDKTYTDYGCASCGIKELVVLQPHHIEEKYKAGYGVGPSGVSFVVGGDLSIEALVRELNKCVILCANCHLKVHAGMVDVLTLARVHIEDEVSIQALSTSSIAKTAENWVAGDLIEFEGESLTLGTWARRKNFDYQTLKARIKAGWSIERALTTPVAKRITRNGEVYGR